LQKTEKDNDGGRTVVEVKKQNVTWLTITIDL